MKREAAVLAALLLGVGCSHSTPKPTEARTLKPAPGRLASAGRTSNSLHGSSPPTAPARAKNDDAIYFDFDSAVLRPTAGPVLQEVGGELLHSAKSVRVEGNCDERGTTEYNMVLGDRRAWEAKRYLERLGVPGKRISVISYGSERPKVLGHDESAWAQNRRDDFKVQ